MHICLPLHFQSSIVLAISNYEALVEKKENQGKPFKPEPYEGKQEDCHRPHHLREALLTGG